jgi:putative nucleotidyltransferase with HDIG domain
MEPASFWQRISGIKELPTLPIIYFKVNKVLHDTEASIQGVADIIEMDQAMSSKVLHIVNSAFYGFRSKISTISQAVMILGFNTVKNAIVSVSILDVFALKTKFQGFDVKNFWSHSIAVAVISKRLAQESRIAPPDDAFVAGLLHDMGKLIMIQYFKEEFGRVWEEMQKEGTTFYEAEKKVLPVDHAQIGAYLAQKWLFPEPLTYAISNHHANKITSPIDGLSVCVLLGNLVSKYKESKLPLETYVFPDKIDLAINPVIENFSSIFPEIQVEIEMANEFFLEGM